MKLVCRRTSVIPAALLVSLATVSLAGQGLPTDVVHVANGFDKQPFDYTCELDSDHDTFCIYRLTYPSPVLSPVPQNNTIPAELYLPKGLGPGSKPRPAVICLHILGGGFELTRLQCTALAARGIPAIWFKLPYYAERGTPSGTRALAADPAMFAKALAQGVKDVRRTVDLMASRAEVNPQQIGVMGVSMGGILAGNAAEQEPRITRAVLLLAGGDLLPVVHHARETRLLSETIHRLSPAQRTMVEQAILQADPLQHAAALRQRAMDGRVLMINAAEDEVIPRVCTEKLASALGIQQQVMWLDGLGHYTALVALPRALKTAVDFFAQDLPAGAEPPRPDGTSQSPRHKLVQLLQQFWSLVAVEPAAGHCHLADLEVQVVQKNGKQFNGRIRLVHGAKPKFSIEARVSGLAEISLGVSDAPWMASNKVLFQGKKTESEKLDPLAQVNPLYVKRLGVVEGVVSTLAIAPEILDQWISVDAAATKGKPQTIRFARRGESRDRLQLVMHDDTTPQRLEFDIQGTHGSIVFRAWQIGTVAMDALYEPPRNLPVKEVAGADLTRMWAAALNFAAETALPVAGRPVKPADSSALQVVARDSAGHGLLCQSQGKRILFVEGTPEQMGTAQGQLLREPIARLTERVVYGVGAADSMNAGIWWFDRTAEIERRTAPFLPPRFIAECDAMGRAAGISIRDARAANLFPERFHCSGTALRGKATIDGRIVHARVLDYMRDIGLQDYACVQVFMPIGRNAWISAGYAGFAGTVTAMNERGLAIGEMGGRGEGKWDGVPMSFLLRDIMERAATVDEALDILRHTPRTCEYYYVISDKHRAMAGVHSQPEELEILGPGQQNPRLPRVPQDTVLMSADRRAKALSERIQKEYGHIDAARLMEIIKRPVAMESNLHDAVFAPETLEFWIADAGRTTPACDEPYAHFNLAELLAFYRSR
jgi:isopenicillin-N N-acyltransferase like protein